MAEANAFNCNFSSLAFFCLAFIALNFITSPAEARGNGTATYYSPDTSSPSACLNSSAIGGGKFVAMVPARAFNNGAACGRVYKIRCVGAAAKNYPAQEDPCKEMQWVTVTVGNLCSGDGCATFTLSADAFDIIAKRDSGRVQITYRRLRLNDYRAIHQY